MKIFKIYKYRCALKGGTCCIGGERRHNNMVITESGTRWYHAKCMIGNVFVCVDIVARSSESKNYILQDVLSVDIIFDESEGVDTTGYREAYIVGEMTGDKDDVKKLRSMYPKVLVPINIRQHKIDSLDI